MRWIWTPSFEHTFRLGIACTVFDAVCIFVCYHYGIMYMRTTVPTFLALCISRVPVFIIAKSQFNRILVWMGWSSALLSILFIALCGIILLTIRHKAGSSPPPLAVFLFFLIALFFDGWLAMNIAMLSVLLVDDTTLPSNQSSLTM